MRISDWSSDVCSSDLKETGTNGIAARDKLSTKLFNYFAQPPAQRSFCSRANEIAQIVSSTPSAQVVEQAPANLAKLDEPFVDFYESYAKYQAERSEERRVGKECCKYVEISVVAVSLKKKS